MSGRERFFPNYDTTQPDPETAEIASFLERLNLSGLLTNYSQPGRFDDDRNAQRAFVEGYSQKPDALALAAKALYSDLHLQVLPPGVEAGYMVPVTIEDGRPFTWVGSSQGVDEELDRLVGACSGQARRELETAWYVVAIDLEWGRKRHLWKTLLETPREGYSCTPHPRLGVEFEIYY